MKRKTFASAIIIVFVVAALYIGTILYFQEVISQMHSQLTAQIASLQHEISDKLQQPYIVTDLGILDKASNETYNENNPATYNHLLIYGQITNMGFSTAFNAGLQVIAMDSEGEILVNKTVPLTTGNYSAGDQGSYTLSVLLRQEILQTELALYHKGVATTWTVKPVYTNTP